VLFQHLSNLLITVRLGRVLRFDEVPEVLLDAFGRDRVSVNALD
jgi:hypothetical protein